jgi:hypothetical protein
MKIEIELSKAKYEFLVLLLSDRHSLSTENKAMVLQELCNRLQSEQAEVEKPH